MRTRWTPERDALLRQLVADLKPVGSQAAWAPVGEALGVSGKAAGVRWSHLKAAGTDGDRETRGMRGPSEPSASETLSPSSPLSPTPLTEAEMVELFQVDLTRWDVTRLSHNTWQQGSKGPDGELCHQPLYQTTLHLKRIPGAESLVALTDQLLRSLRDAAPPRGPFVITKAKGEMMMSMNRPDLHLGKLGWSAETEAADYDIGIAVQCFRDGASDLFAKTANYQFAHILIPSGNDEQHTDNLRSETTAGTRVDSDSRYHKMFRTAVRERIWLIQEALQRAPLVYDLTVPGNHDRLGAFTVGEVVRAHFHHEPRVVFDNEPPLRKYHRFGTTLIGLTHGSEEKHSDLPLIMAQERPQDWAETLYRYWYLGHLHTRRLSRYTAGNTHLGVEVRVIASLSGTDAWHAQHGYIKNRRAMEAFIYDIKDGEVGSFLSRLPEV